MENQEKARILIVEDDPAIAENIARTLNGAGFECDIAHGTIDAYNKVLENSYKAVISDIGLPDYFGKSPDNDNGFLFMDAVRKTTGFENVPIIAETGWDDQEILDEAKKCGANVVLQKIGMNEKLVKTLHDLGVTAGGQK